MAADQGRLTRSDWRLAVSTGVFALWAPLSFVGLPLAALMIAARPRGTRQWGAALLVGIPSVALLLLSVRGDIVSAAAHAYIVLVAATFIALTLVAPARFFPQAVRASAIALGAGMLLARVVLGPEAGGMLQWEATRQASETLRALTVRPEVSAVLDPTVRFLGETVPALLVLQALAGLGLAWQWHQRVTAYPLGTALAPFREFRFADGWVWAVVAAVTVWITPLLAGLKAAALNLLVVAGILYLLRGAAIVVAFAVILGVSPLSLALGLLAAAVFAVPLLFVVPGLATLGMSDTWLQFRRRLAGRPNAS